jgi:DNA-3-methyladenine glycosylase II
MNEQIAITLSKDSRLADIIKVIVLPKLEIEGNIYLNMIDSIISQQLSTKVAAIIFDRFINLFDDCNPSPKKILELDVEDMRNVGLSYQKANYIKNIAQHWIDKNHFETDWEAMNDDEIIDDLTQIKGVGVWTVQMILIFNLLRHDVFPINDLGVRNGMIHLYNVKSEGKVLMSELEKIAENWKPYRSWGSRLMWKHYDSTKIK